MACIRDYDFHPPDEVRLCPMPTHHWFKVNYTTDPAGVFVDTTSSDDVPPFTFNCDIATPAPDEQRVRLSAVPLLRPAARPSW
jgi:hypothetical protein